MKEIIEIDLKKIPREIVLSEIVAIERNADNEICTKCLFTVRSFTKKN